MKSTNRKIAITITGLIASICAFSAFADTVQWKAASGGSFGSASNWSPEGIPGSGDTLRFNVFYNQTGDYTITDNADRSFAALDYLYSDSNRQSWANVTFDLGGFTWSVAGAWTQYTLGTLNNITYEPTITYKNGHINVTGDFLAPCGGLEYGGTTHVQGCEITAANMNFAGRGTRVYVDEGAKLTATGNIGMPNAGGDRSVAVISGAGTSIGCANFLMNHGENSNFNGGARVVVEKGAVVRMTGELSIGNSKSSISNVFCVTDGGTAVVVRASKSYGVRLGKGSFGYPGGFCRLEVAGEGSLLTTTNANWISGDSTSSPSNLYCFSDGALVDIAGGYLSTGWNGVGNGLVVDGNAHLRINYATSDYNNYGLEIGHSAGASNNYAIVSNGAKVELLGNSWLGVGGGLGKSGNYTSGSFGSSLTVSDATFRLVNGLRLGCGTEAVSNRIAVADGASFSVNLSSFLTDGINIGGVNGKEGHEFRVEGSGTSFASSNACWVLGASAASYGNTLHVRDNASVFVTNGWITVGKLTRGNRMIVEDSARMYIRNAGDNRVWSRMGLEIGASEAASNNVCIIRNGARINADKDFAVKIGGGADINNSKPNINGGANCSLIVENGQIGGLDAAMPTDVMVNVGYKTTATNALLAVRGARAKVRCHGLFFGERARIEFKPGASGFDNVPVEVLGVVARTHDYEMTEELMPRMRVDVTDWCPKNGGDLTLLKADRTAWNWNSSSSPAMMTNLVATAVIDANGRGGYSVNLSDSGDEIHLKRIRFGFSLFVR